MKLFAITICRRPFYKVKIEMTSRSLSSPRKTTTICEFNVTYIPKPAILTKTELLMNNLKEIIKIKSQNLFISPEHIHTHTDQVWAHNTWALTPIFLATPPHTLTRNPLHNLPLRQQAICHKQQLRVRVRVHGLACDYCASGLPSWCSLKQNKCNQIYLYIFIDRICMLLLYILLLTIKVASERVSESTDLICSLLF